MRPIEVEAPAAVDAGEPMRVGVSVRHAGDTRVVRVEAIDAEGNEVKPLREVFLMEGDNETVELQPAFNDALGDWTIRAVDVATGQAAEAAVTVR